MLGPGHAVELDGVGHAALAANAGRVDGQERFAVALEADVHAVARRTRHLADDDALILGDAVDESALAGVTSADNGDLQGHVRGNGSSGVGRGQLLDDAIEQGLLAPVLVGADRNDVVGAELVKLGRLRFQSFRVALVGHEEDRPARLPQALGHGLVQRHHAGPDVHDEQQDAGLGDGRLDLPFHLGGQLAGLIHAHAAGVHHLEGAFARLDQALQPIPGYAGRRIDDGNASARQPVEQRRLADVGSAHDRNDRNSHSPDLP